MELGKQRSSVPPTIQDATGQFTRQLAAQVVALQPCDIPDTVKHRAEQCVLDFLGVALGASHHPVVDKLLSVARATGSAPRATLIGRPERADCLWAALINGSMAHVLDFDDTHFPTILHGYTPVLAALFAAIDDPTVFPGAGERDTGHSEVSGEEFLTAFVAGYETASRVALCLHPGHYKRGWHLTGTAGVFGASAACGKLFHLNEDQMTSALGLAAAQASGLRVMFGTMTKPFHAGKAAQNGLLAALLAREGFTSAPESLEGRRGFCHVFCDEPALWRLTEDWAIKWELLASGFKPYPCGVVTHPAIDGVLALRREHRLEPASVKSIHARCHPLVLELTGNANPVSGLEGKFSVYHCLAVALVDGTVAMQSFTDGRVVDPLITDVRARVHVTPDSRLAQDQAEVSIELSDGHVVRHFVQHASGTPEQPLTDAQLQRKFSALLAWRPQSGPLALDQSTVDRIRERALGIRGLRDVRALLHLTRPNQSQCGEAAT